MDFRFPYLVAMQDQNPKMYRALKKAGELDRFVQMKANEARRMYLELTKDAPKESNGQPTMQARREAEEQIRGLLFEFPDDMMTNWQEEKNSLQQDQPMVAVPPAV